MAGIESRMAEYIVNCIRERRGMEARIVVVLMREEERSNGALITDSLFGFAYLVLLISCDAAATMVRVSTKTPYNGPKTRPETRTQRANVPTLGVRGFLAIRHGKREIHAHVTSLGAVRSRPPFRSIE